MGPVVEAFSATFDPAAGGAALSIWHDGQEVVNIYGGLADVRTQRPWAEDTKTVLFSTTKGLAALTAAWLVANNRLDVDAPVSSVWPEFAVQGKESITVGDVLAHRAGLIAPDDDMTIDDLIDIRAFAARLAAQAPLWPSASKHLYHPFTWGPLISEILRRATGEDLPEVFAREIATPLDAAVTLRADDHDVEQVAHVTASTEWSNQAALIEKVLPKAALRAFTAGGALPSDLVGAGGVNDPRVQKAGLVSAAGLGTASGLARIWSATVASTYGVRLLGDEDVKRLVAVRSEGAGWDALSEDGSEQRLVTPDGELTGDDSVSGSHPRWGAGVQLGSGSMTWLGPNSLGHDGAGGQTAFADPDYGIAFAYLTNRVRATPPFGPIIDALRITLDNRG
ncbi:hypothetical protein ACG83_39340 [Frankia sp. R43]|uniref:serine hydrolase domain-containing protein n=1 Tax=Frankia sp. R43 TaxID=269536 RepID=UPI0006CA1075|nr:serine hydrolase domain-containing protein [Frankia sp. R43]KPM50600.1 hypothetical protein ACG83_39340 [Frankia sp. R43]